MAILTDSNKKNTVGLDRINDFLHPVSISKFNVNKALHTYLQTGLKTHKDQDVFQSLDKVDRSYCTSLELIPTKIAKIQFDKQNARAIASMQSHINPGNEVHFLLDGGLILYFVLREGHQKLILKPGARFFIPKDVEHWIDFTAETYLVLASYHSKSFDTFHSKIKYTNTHNQ
ncbi:cupin domain-containing protein [Candidatus Neptunichlamydia sp. REUL1]|uniref:cupin domain-containing protein n=1 Tax=Candidatus Neptunichlamydia sp. REUL1 TaxID=3064277 RepID=UPI00292E915E|nr:hypothetical protein [Candidatus Neptunochlamydia sp. REUL1]